MWPDPRGRRERLLAWTGAGLPLRGCGRWAGMKLARPPAPAASPECRDSAPAPSEFRTGAMRRELPVPRPPKAAPLLSHRGGTGDSCPPSCRREVEHTWDWRAVATTSGATRRSHPPAPTPACVRRSSPSSPCLQFATLGSHLHPRHRSPVGAGGGAPRGRSCLLKDPGLLP